VELLAFIAINLEHILRKFASLYVGMLVLLLAAGLGLPLPEDVPLLLGGCLCRLGYGVVPYAILVGLVGVLSGDVFLYVVGRKFGTDALKTRPVRLLITRTHVAQVKLLFRKWGHLIIFGGRFFAGVRSVMCLTAGICRVPAWKFILIDVGGAMVTVPILVGLGWWFSDSIANVVKGFHGIEYILGGLAATLLIGWVIYIHITRTRGKAIERRFSRHHGAKKGLSDDAERSGD